MKLMLRSYSNLLLSVRLVTQINKGKRSAGIDNQRALTPEDRTALVRDMMRYKTWLAKPVKRIYIPKAETNKLRPLGIPVISDRVAQAIVKNALEPSWEARFEPNSYGFRPGRGCHDALEQCWRYFNKRGHRVWILDADIKGAFDNISHDFILENLGPVPGRELIKQWLKAGYVEADTFHRTEAGTPQGGVISPLLLNIALNGMERFLGPHYGFVRYADDFVVCARTREEIEAAQPKIAGWLEQRGLALHPEKTRIVHIDDGFNFLAFSIRRYKGSCFLMPQKDKVLAFLAKIRQWLSSHRQATAEDVIRHLNPILRGWANYYKIGVSKRVFSYISHQLWQMIWRWCLRRHPNKGKDWVFRKYFQTEQQRSWNFHGSWQDAKGLTKRLYLFDIASVAIKRHVKVRAMASPDDPMLTKYWRERRQKRLAYPLEQLR
jgi:RNA-directed DNA polymerase